MRWGPTRRGLGTILALVVVGGCSAETADPDSESGENLLPPAVIDAASTPIDGAISETVDLDGLEVWLGSTLDTEGTSTDQLLAAISVQALEEAGAVVRHQNDLGGVAARDALTAGEIGLYWEGAGDAWTAILRQPAEGLTGDEIHDRLADRDLQENGVAWLDPLRFDDGPRFAEAAAPPDGDPVGRMSAMGELLSVEEGEDLVVCAPSSFSTYPEDGRVAVEAALALTFTDEQLRSYQPEPVYPETADGTCRFGVVESTSGRVAEYDLAILDDDIGAFLPNPPTPAIREDLLVDQPEIATVLNALAGRLDADELREMNRAVLVDGANVADVAASWLRAEGLTMSDPVAGS